MKLVTWNMRRATHKSVAWEYLQQLDPEVAFLQEVNSIPESIMSEYRVFSLPAISKAGKVQTFHTVIISKHPFVEDVKLSSTLTWVNDARAFFKGNIIAKAIEVNNQKLNLVNAYSPAWIVPDTFTAGVDVTGVKLEQNPHVWATEILWKCLLDHPHIHSDGWIVGGDFNSSETFDYLWGSSPRGNLEIIERMNALDLYDALRTHHGRLIPTHKNNRGGKIIHQLDHLYMSRYLIDAVQDCFTGRHEDVFDSNLSDHLPIICTTVL
jgi:exonuclease III